MDGHVIAHRDRPAGRIVERAGVVLPLDDVGRQRGPLEHGAHLLDERDKEGVEDAEVERETIRHDFTAGSGVSLHGPTRGSGFRTGPPPSASPAVRARWRCRRGRRPAFAHGAPVPATPTPTPPRSLPPRPTIAGLPGPLLSRPAGGGPARADCRTRSPRSAQSRSRPVRRAARARSDRRGGGGTRPRSSRLRPLERRSRTTARDIAWPAYARASAGPAARLPRRARRLPRARAPRRLRQVAGWRSCRPAPALHARRPGGRPRRGIREPRGRPPTRGPSRAGIRVGSPAGPRAARLRRRTPPG